MVAAARTVVRLISFKMKFGTPFGKLMRAFCQHQGVAIQSVRFLFDGRSILEQDTPMELEMENFPLVDVMFEQSGD